jgi:hypothetical protein
MSDEGRFFQECRTCDPAYMNIRDLERFSEDKEFVETLWRIYRPHADRHFRDDVCTHFQERFWEMYLGVTFITHGFTIDAGGKKGPEFYIKEQEPKIWIEAIAPGAGAGADAVPEMEYGRPVATRVPSEEIILRLRHAIQEKYRKYVQYLKDNIVAPDEPYIIAVNSKRIRSIVGDPELPFIAKSIFPFGNLVAVWDTYEKHIVDSFYSFRDSIEKKSGNKVSTNVFLDPEYAGISAVLYSTVDALNRPKVCWSDFILVHNPLAGNRLSLGFFAFGVEHWKDDHELKHKSWNYSSSNTRPEGDCHGECTMFFKTHAPSCAYVASPDVARR